MGVIEDFERLREYLKRPRQPFVVVMSEAEYNWRRQLLRETYGEDWPDGTYCGSPVVFTLPIPEDDPTLKRCFETE